MKNCVAKQSWIVQITMGPCRIVVLADSAGEAERLVYESLDKDPGIIESVKRGDVIYVPIKGG